MERQTMNHATSPKPESTIAKRVRQIRDRWSPQERLRRAEVGRRRSLEFMRRIIEVPVEPEIWAVGALGDEDLRRIAG